MAYISVYYVLPSVPWIRTVGVGNLPAEILFALVYNRLTRPQNMADDFSASHHFGVPKFECRDLCRLCGQGAFRAKLRN
jgi:hypothetical protein